MLISDPSYFQSAVAGGGGGGLPAKEGWKNPSRSTNGMKQLKSGGQRLGRP